VFVDVGSDDFVMDVAQVEQALTPRTKAVVAVHLYGQAVDLDPLLALCKKRGLRLIEDCAQAPGSLYHGQRLGTLGDAAAFSFYPTKNLGAIGDGGAVATRDPAIAERIKRLRNGGQTDRYHHMEPGINSRLDELQAAVLRARLPFLRGWTDRRRELAAQYREQLRGASATPLAERDAGHVYHLFVVRSPHRRELQAHLASRGIETLIHYPVPIPRQPAVASVHPDECPIASRGCEEVLSLPLHPGMGEADTHGVAAAIHAFQPLTAAAPTKGQ
jgi:dTDP-4-amino-4,6-dideoxygalactose transaminase